MKETKVYFISSKEIIEAFKKEGIDVLRVEYDGDKSIRIIRSYKTEKQYEKLFLILKKGNFKQMEKWVICANILHVEYNHCFIYAPDWPEKPSEYSIQYSNISIPGVFCLVF